MRELAIVMRNHNAVVAWKDVRVMGSADDYERESPFAVHTSTIHGVVCRWR
jgi:hypothetical protein